MIISVNRGINFGRYRKEVEELLKLIYKEERNFGILEKVEERSSERFKFFELNVLDLFYVSVGFVFGVVFINGVFIFIFLDFDSVVSINVCY